MKFSGNRPPRRTWDLKIFLETLFRITECRLHADQDCSAHLYNTNQEVVRCPSVFVVCGQSYISRFWAFSAAALLAILLFYWLYGGVIAFLLVCFGVSGVLYQVKSKLTIPNVIVDQYKFHRLGIGYFITLSSLLTLVSLCLPLPSSTCHLTIFSSTLGKPPTCHVTTCELK